MAQGRSDDVGADRELARQLTGIRHRLVDRVYWAAGGLALLYLPMVLWRAHSVGWHYQLRLHAALIVVALLMVLAMKRLPLFVKSAVLVSVFLLLGLVGVFTMGMVGAGYWWCLQGAVLVATFFSIRAGIVVAVLCAALLSVVGVGFVEGWLAVPFDMNAHLRSASAWAAFLIVMVFAPLALLLALGGYQTTIETLVAQINVQRLQLQQQVDHDALTGLPSSRLVDDRLDMAVRQARRSGRKVAALFVDLDGFKAINDRCGHAAGDHVLQQVAQRLRAAVRDEDTVARIGGDEFLLVVGALADGDDAARLAAKLVAAVGQAFEWAGEALQVGASVGIALFPDHADNAQALRRRADAAMYGVKKSGKNGYAFATTQTGASRSDAPPRHIGPSA